MVKNSIIKDEFGNGYIMSVITKSSTTNTDNVIKEILDFKKENAIKEFAEMTLNSVREGMELNKQLDIDKIHEFVLNPQIKKMILTDMIKVPVDNKFLSECKISKTNFVEKAYEKMVELTK